MNTEPEESISFYQLFHGILSVAMMVLIICVVVLLIRKVTSKKVSSVKDIFKLLWLISAVVPMFYVASLYFPEMTVESWNRKIMDHIPFEGKFLKNIFAFIITIVLTLYCALAFEGYFKEANQDDACENK